MPYAALNPVNLEMEAGGSTGQGDARAWLYVEPDGDVRLEDGEQRALGNLLRDPWERIWEAMNP